MRDPAPPAAETNQFLDKILREKYGMSDASIDDVAAHPKQKYASISWLPVQPGRKGRF